MLRQTLEICQRVQGPGNSLTLLTSDFLSLVLLKTSRFSEAEGLLRQSLEKRLRLFPNEWRTAQAQSLLGEALTGEKRYAEAEPLLLAGFSGLKAQSVRIPASADVSFRHTGECLVKLYLEREAALSAAVRAGDAAAIGQFLTDDFELRAGARAGRPVPRADFVATLVRTRDSGGDVAGMAVHDLGNAAIVSFTQGTRVGLTFVVDVWRQQGSDWKLAIRYASPAGSDTYPIPGAGAGEPEIPKKY